MGRMELEWDYSYLVQYGLSSAVLTVLVFRLVSPAVSSRFPAYNRLSEGDQADWNSRILSNLNAAMCIVLCTHVLIYEEGVHRDTVWYDSTVTRICVSLISGYLLGDMVIMVLWCHYSRGELLGFLFHHAATMYAYYFVSVNGVLCYFAMARMLAEYSTPFMNQRWYLDVSGYNKKGKAYITNGVFFLISFFVCRVLLMPWFWMKIWEVTGTEVTRPLGHIEVTVMYIPSVILDALNLYWFSKACRGVVKMFSHPIPKEAGKEHTE